MKKKIKNIHLIGIGGSGMNGVAVILLQLGYKISGSDILNSIIIQNLIQKGAKIYFNHSENNVKNADLIIISSAISYNNPEIISAQKKNIPIFHRAEIIQKLMKYKFGIAISGTHGKTTTTSMIVDIYINSGKDPTFINGGLIKSINAYAQLGLSNDFIVEADESDASFLFLKPNIIIITNIESDHIDYYNGSFCKLKETFFQFINNLSKDSIIIICIDNIILKNFLPKIQCNIITYGFNKNANIRIVQYKQYNFISQFIIIRKNKLPLSIKLNMPGKHNALNATAAVALAIHKGIKKKYIIQSLKNFKGTHRRFEFVGTFHTNKTITMKNKKNILIDDYGHHPTEIYETIKTIRNSWPNKRLIMIFQPHRYTRTHYLYNDFIKVLSQVDDLIILDVYSANEPIIVGADSNSLCLDINKLNKIHATLLSDPKMILNVLNNKLCGNNIVLVQGAGNIDKIVKYLFPTKVII
ncbi:UDP-N-acetylmuramate--L-alanine ligase [Buchnera aphidicola]|uniref:UDP-N-acetylmuramate--L-alanine ligase n=1 Tax=Buchnera aphidicola TaxID=9 RepID=UPI003BEEB764